MNPFAFSLIVFLVWIYYGRLDCEMRRRARACLQLFCLQNFFFFFYSFVFISILSATTHYWLVVVVARIFKGKDKHNIETPVDRRYRRTQIQSTAIVWLCVFTRAHLLDIFRFNSIRNLHALIVVVKKKRENLVRALLMLQNLRLISPI